MMESPQQRSLSSWKACMSPPSQQVETWKHRRPPAPAASQTLQLKSKTAVVRKKRKAGPPQKMGTARLRAVIQLAASTPETFLNSSCHRRPLPPSRHSQRAARFQQLGQVVLGELSQVAKSGTASMRTATLRGKTLQPTAFGASRIQTASELMQQLGITNHRTLQWAHVKVCF